MEAFLTSAREVKLFLELSDIEKVEQGDILTGNLLYSDLWHDPSYRQPERYRDVLGMYELSCMKEDATHHAYAEVKIQRAGEEALPRYTIQLSPAACASLRKLLPITDCTPHVTFGIFDSTILEHLRRCEEVRKQLKAKSDCNYLRS